LEFRSVDFCGGGKPENPEKNPRSKDENQQQTQPTCNAWSGGIEHELQRCMGSERPYHCAIPANFLYLLIHKARKTSDNEQLYLITHFTGQTLPLTLNVTVQ